MCRFVNLLSLEICVNMRKIFNLAENFTFQKNKKYACKLEKCPAFPRH
jgi:hypothetical protein